MTNQSKHHMQGGLQMANGRNQSELEDPNTVKPLPTKEGVIESLKNLGLHQISARKDLLNIDTTYQIDANTTETFLPPNFYIDRIVDYITANYTPKSDIPKNITSNTQK